MAHSRSIVIPFFYSFIFFILCNRKRKIVIFEDKSGNKTRVIIKDEFPSAPIFDAPVVRQRNDIKWSKSRE